MKENAVFIDTAGWLALGNKTDHWHTQAVNLYQEFARNKIRRITTDAVLVEICNALCKPPFRILAVSLIDKICFTASLGIIEIILTTKQLFEQNFELYKNRLDKEWSLTDCIGFVVMDEHKVKEAFTTDRHFEQAGFITLLK